MMIEDIDDETVTRLLYVHGEEYAAMMFEDDYKSKDSMIVLADDLESSEVKTKCFENYTVQLIVIPSTQQSVISLVKNIYGDYDADKHRALFVVD